MKRFVIGVVLTSALLGAANLALGQDDQTASDSGPSRDTLHATPYLAFIPRSLKQLVALSDLIIVGRVESALPSRFRDADVSKELETPLVVETESVLKGPRGIKRVIVWQSGGKLGGLRQSSSLDPLAAVGETYVFFLYYDNRKVTPSDPTLNTPRTFVTGVWNGKFKVVEGRIRIAKVDPAPGLRPYDRKPERDFVQAVRELVESEHCEMRLPDQSRHPPPTAP